MNIHLEPKHQKYTFGYTKVCICTDCGAIGLEEDFPESAPCHLCGGEKYVGCGRWKPPKYEIATNKNCLGFKAMNSRRVSNGYWEIKL